MSQNSATPANARQVGGSHYKTGGLQHWDLETLYGWDSFQYQITKYVMRWRDKNGLQDLEKCRHFVDKYIEEVTAGRITKENRREPLGRQDWLDKLGAEEPIQSHLLTSIFQMLKSVRLPGDHTPLDVLDRLIKENAALTTQLAKAAKALKEAAELRTELSTLTGCSSHDGKMELDLLRDRLSELCCGEPATCKRACTPKGEFRAKQELLSQGVKDGMFVAPLGSLNPSAWKGFTYEGTKEEHDLFRCQVCRQHFSVAVDHPPLPHLLSCPGKPTELKPDAEALRRPLGGVPLCNVAVATSPASDAPARLCGKKAVYGLGAQLYCAEHDPRQPAPASDSNKHALQDGPTGTELPPTQ